MNKNTGQMSQPTSTLYYNALSEFALALKIEASEAVAKTGRRWSVSHSTSFDLDCRQIGVTQAIVCVCVCTIHSFEDFRCYRYRSYRCFCMWPLSHTRTQYLAFFVCVFTFFVPHIRYYSVSNERRSLALT